MAKTCTDEEMHSRYRKMRVNGKQVNVHRYVMEQVLGRPLELFEYVHHINGNRYDNRPENLELVTPKEHKSFHPNPFTQETRDKISASLIGHKRNLGKVHTAEHNLKISASLIGNKRSLGKLHTQEHNDKISASLRRSMTPEVRAKISASMRVARKNKNWSTRKKTE
jgi:hypothetical protein